MTDQIDENLERIWRKIRYESNTANEAGADRALPISAPLVKGAIAPVPEIQVFPVLAISTEVMTPEIPQAQEEAYQDKEVEIVDSFPISTMAAVELVPAIRGTREPEGGTRGEEGWKRVERQLDDRPSRSKPASLPEVAPPKESFFRWLLGKFGI